METVCLGSPVTFGHTSASSPTSMSSAVSQNKGIRRNRLLYTYLFDNVLQLRDTQTRGERRVRAGQHDSQFRELYKHTVWLSSIRLRTHGKDAATVPQRDEVRRVHRIHQQSKIHTRCELNLTCNTYYTNTIIV